MTLVEMLIVSTLSVLLIMSLTAAAGNMLSIYRVGRGEMGLGRDLALGLGSMMRSIRNAKDAGLVGSHGIVLTDALGEQITYDWSGTAGDPLTLKINSGAVLPLVDGLAGLSFQIQTKDVEVQQTSTLNTQLFLFDYWPGTLVGNQWRGVTYIGTSDYSGFAFQLISNQAIDAIELTRLKIRLGKLNGHSGNLRICLYETITPGIPRPFGPMIAYKDFPSAGIPWATDIWDPWNNLLFVVFNLDPSFTIYPNRSYCILLHSLGPGDACAMRVRMSDTGDMPTSDEYNGLWPMISHDSMATWIPILGSSDMRAWDIPAELTGDVITVSEGTMPVKHSVEVSLTLERNKETLKMTRRELLMGGGTH
jgi:hypothetical protein